MYKGCNIGLLSLTMLFGTCMLTMTKVISPETAEPLQFTIAGMTFLAIMIWG